MYRVKLSFTIGILLMVILALATVLYWGMQRTAFYTERSRLASDALEAYVQLSHDAYRHFKEMTDVIVLDGEAGANDINTSYENLIGSLRKLKKVTLAEINLVQDEEDGQSEKEEIERIDEMERLLFEGIAALERVDRLSNTGAKVSARKVFSRVLEETIDRQFKPLIDLAIAEEREEVMEARLHGDELLQELSILAEVTAIVASVFAFVIGIVLLRSLSVPLQVLVNGVRKVAKGDLSHRIVLPGRNEFTYLAKNFNEMTAELNQHQQQLLETQSDLEQKVQQRTGELQEANTKLLALDEGRRRFFADISHELRTPLTAIRGEAEVTARGREKSTDEYREALRRIVDLSGQLTQLVDDLLMLARADAVSMRIELKPLRLDDLLRHLCDDVRVLAQKKQLELQIDLTPQPIIVRGDALRLRQLFLILLDNACRYSKPGGIINVELVEESACAVVFVRDQGIGMTDNEQNMVFERFFRGEAARKAVQSGSGLGLPLAKSIVEAHHGEIKLSSKLNESTQVTIILPLLLNTDSVSGHIIR